MVSPTQFDRYLLSVRFGKRSPFYRREGRIVKCRLLA